MEQRIKDRFSNAILVEAMMQQKFMSNNDLIQHLKTMLRKTQGFFIQGEDA